MKYHQNAFCVYWHWFVDIVDFTQISNSEDHLKVLINEKNLTWDCVATKNTEMKREPDCWIIHW